MAIAAWCGACGAPDLPTEPPDASDIDGIAEAHTTDGRRIVALRSGWVRVKASHRELDGAAALRFPRIIADKEWAEWMPIIVYLIEHDDGYVLVDTGPAPEVNDPDYYACDKRSDFFYRRNLLFEIPAEETLERRLEALGVDPQDIETVVVTHLHGDHVGNLDLFSRARVLVGPGNWPKHTGAFTCRLPEDFAPTIASYDDDAVGVFEESLSLSKDGRVRMVPLPGHTPGHAGVLVSDDDRRWLIAGDATFDRDQTDRRAVCGASQDVDEARATQDVIADQLGQDRTVLLPAHDSSVFERL